MPDELWTEVHDTVQETGIKTIPKKKKCKKAKWLSEEALQMPADGDFEKGLQTGGRVYTQPQGVCLGLGGSLICCWFGTWGPWDALQE